jgi:hypothetical protein
MQNYPNPFNPATKITYTIPSSSGSAEGLPVAIKVFDILGSEVATLVNEHKPPGSYEIDFDASRLPSGMYFYELRAGGFASTRKMIVVK